MHFREETDRTAAETTSAAREAEERGRRRRKTLRRQKSSNGTGGRSNAANEANGELCVMERRERKRRRRVGMEIHTDRAVAVVGNVVIAKMSQLLSASSRTYVVNATKFTPAASDLIIYSRPVKFITKGDGPALITPTVLA